METFWLPNGNKLLTMVANFRKLKERTKTISLLNEYINIEISKTDIHQGVFCNFILLRN